MGNFFKSLFSSSKAATPEEEKSKNDQKNFDILKYDGVRAQKIGQVAYAIKCFTEALKLQEDFETMTYLVAAYTTANKAEEALEVLNRRHSRISSPLYKKSHAHLLWACCFLLKSSLSLLNKCSKTCRIVDSDF